MPQIIIKNIINETIFPIQIPIELIIGLYKTPELFVFYIVLDFLKLFGGASFISQKKLAQLMNISEPTFITRKKALVKKGLLEIEERPNTVGRQQNIYLKNFSNYHELLKNFKQIKSPDELIEYLDITSKSLKVSSQQGSQLGVNLKKSRSIYNIYNNNTNNNINTISTNSISTNSKGNIKKKQKKGKTFPREDYGKVLKAYNHYKGIDLKGPEIPQALRPIKTMFKAERTPDEIIALMKWFHDHEADKDKTWIKSWTIWTVQKKLPEFVAGKLGGADDTDDFQVL